MRLKVSRARSGLHGSGVGSDGAVRTSSLDRSCEAQWAESLQECLSEAEGGAEVEECEMDYDELVSGPGN